MMATLDDLFSVRRVLVALDSATPGTVLVEAAVDFAKYIEAELEGLFVEDIDLMRLAELPFAQALSLPAGLPQPLDLAVLEGELRALAAGAQHALETRAREMNVRCSFRVVRGRLEAEVRAAAGAADLVILERGGGFVTRHVRLSSSAARAAISAAHPVLLLRGPGAAIESIVAVYDGTAGSGGALAAAARLGSRLRGTETAAQARIAVLCLGKTAALAQCAEKKARQELEREGIAATFRAQVEPEAEQLAAALRCPANALLILPAGLPFLESEAGERLLAESEGPVLLVS